jgi:tRNA(Ile2) C34 agmatinyltransferase TiaS
MLQTQLTTQPISCPECGRDAKPAGINLVRCKICGYKDRSDSEAAHSSILSSNSLTGTHSPDDLKALLNK